MSQFPPRPRLAGSTTPGQRIAGLVLLLPALVVLITQQVIPGVRTLTLSVRDGNLFETGEFVGLGNYASLSGEWLRTIVVTLSLGLLVGAIGVTVGIMLGRLARRAPPGWGRVTLALLALVLVTYGPGTFVLSQFWTGQDLNVLIAWQLVAALPVFVIIGAIGGILSRSGSVLLVLGAVVAVGGACLGMQSDLGVFNAQVPGSLIQATAFTYAMGGQGAAASAVLGLLLAALGVGAGLMLHAVRPRFDLAQAPPQRAGRSAGVGVLAVVASIVVATLLVILARPWLSQVGNTGEETLGSDAGTTTWWSAGMHTLEAALTVLVTGTAAVAIGYLRPFGRRSLRAMLVVSPWFFVGLLPLVVAIYAGWSPEATEPPYRGLTPQLFTVPLLFVLAYIADGVRSARDSGRRVQVVATIGLVTLVIGVVVVMRSQQLLWDVLFRFDQDSAIQALWTMMSATFGGSGVPIGLIVPIAVLVPAALLLAAAGAAIPGVAIGSARRLPPAPQPPAGYRQPPRA